MNTSFTCSHRVPIITHSPPALHVRSFRLRKLISSKMWQARRDIDEICPSSAGTVGKLGFYGSPPRSCGVVPSKDQLWLPLVTLADKSDDLGNRRCWRVTASPRSELEGLAPILVLLLVINLPNFPFSISFSNFGL
jgi:hypothetical protein